MGQGWSQVSEQDKLDVTAFSRLLGFSQPGTLPAPGLHPLSWLAPLSLFPDLPHCVRVDREQVPSHERPRDPAKWGRVGIQRVREEEVEEKMRERDCPRAEAAVRSSPPPARIIMLMLSVYSYRLWHSVL